MMDTDTMKPMSERLQILRDLEFEMEKWKDIRETECKEETSSIISQKKETESFGS
jgi:hypothetical protein